MYGIIHKQIFDSTVMAEGYEVVIVFIYMITTADKNHICDMPAYSIAKNLVMPLEKVEHALERLSRPDPESKSSEHEGRRVIPLKDISEIESNRGFFIVNRQEYIDQASTEHRRKKDNERQQRKRESVTKPEMSRSCHDNIDIDIDINKKKGSTPKKRFKRPTVVEVRAYCEERKNKIDPDDFVDYYEQVGWVVGKGAKPMKCWKSAIRQWERSSVAKPNNTNPLAGAI